LTDFPQTNRRWYSSTGVPLSDLSSVPNLDRTVDSSFPGFSTSDRSSERSDTFYTSPKLQDLEIYLTRLRMFALTRWACIHRLPLDVQVQVTRLEIIVTRRVFLAGNNGTRPAPYSPI